MSNNTFKFLNKLVNKGFLLHGSNKKFDIISPNKKEKLDPRAGKLKAVYATNDSLIAMFLAIIAPQKLPLVKGNRKNMISWGYDKIGKIHFALSPNYYTHNAFDMGYIYVVEQSIFKPLKKLPHEFYSYEKITPKEVVFVKPHDFLSIIKPEIIPVEAIKKAGFHTEEEIKLMGYN